MPLLSHFVLALQILELVLDIGLPGNSFLVNFELLFAILALKTCELICEETFCDKAAWESRLFQLITFELFFIEIVLLLILKVSVGLDRVTVVHIGRIGINPVAHELRVGA